MADVQHTKIRVLCEKEHVFDIADKLARLFHLRAVVERSQNSPNPHTRWVMVETGVPYALARDASADDFLAKFGITKLSAMQGIVAYNVAPLNNEDDASWANWKDRKRNHPQPKDDMEEY